MNILANIFLSFFICAEILFSSNNNMIKYFLIAIVCLQASLSQQVLSLPYFDSGLNNFEETFKCYIEQKAIKGSLLMVLQIWDLFYQWSSTNNLTNPQQAYEIYNEPVHVVVSTDTRIDHSLFGELAQKALKDQPIKALWVVVSNGCIKSCDQLKGFLKDLRKAFGPDKTIGILTGPQYWSNTFNTREGCPQVPLAHPLLYFSTYFKQFYPFGGWKKAEYIRSSMQKVPGCKVYGDDNSVEYYTKQ